MGLSDRIEAFITELLKDEDDWLNLKRNELAEVFNCVPSQINYVISTRFNRDRGYVVESRRGGGGYLRIRRISTAATVIDNLINAVGSSLSFNDALSYVSQLRKANIINDKEARIMLGAVSDRVLKNNDNLRADIFKGMIMELV
ncbi:MAG: CtsR family transcriptional regulator [Clostridia bacterium]|nr:CtsR family transcriptional regulator [Clostridia bacterium]